MIELTAPAPTAGGGSSSGEQLLSSTAVNLNSGSAQDLYTVEADEKLIITRAVLRDGSVPFGDGSTNTFTIIRSNDSLALTTATAVTSALTTQAIIFASIPATSRSIAATNKAQFIVDVAYADVCTGVLDLFGYLIAV